jgi:hypothetical protein
MSLNFKKKEDNKMFTNNNSHLDLTSSLKNQVSRRSALKTFGSVAALSFMSPLVSFAKETDQAVTDEDIFNFALNLESLETEYYLRGTKGFGMADADAGASPGTVTGGKMVPWKNEDLKQFMEEVAENELAHVRFYRKTLGGKAVSRPAIDLAGGFKAAGEAAGIANFDPFASEMNFFLGGMMMEDVGVTAYKGAAPLIVNKTFLEAAAGILAVEAYHMGMARSVLYRMGSEARRLANLISDTRDRLDGAGDVDQGIEVGGRANFVPSDANGIAFSRTPQQVLRIVYGTDRAGVSGGALFPNGMNGQIKTT